MNFGKTISKGLSNKLINQLTSVKVLYIYKTKDSFEIVYEDEGKKYHLLISYSIKFDSIYKCNFTFENKTLDSKDKENHRELEEIDNMVKNLLYRMYLKLFILTFKFNYIR